MDQENPLQKYQNSVITDKDMAGAWPAELFYGTEANSVTYSQALALAQLFGACGLAVHGIAAQADDGSVFLRNDVALEMYGNRKLRYVVAVQAPGLEAQIVQAGDAWARLNKPTMPPMVRIVSAIKDVYGFNPSGEPNISEPEALYLVPQIKQAIDSQADEMIRAAQAWGRRNP